MSSTQRKSNNLIVKVISLLTIVRWYNVLLVTVALTLSSLFLFNDFDISGFSTLKDGRLILLLLSVDFIMMAGFIINAFYDFEKDIINRPDETIFGRIVSKGFCLNFYVFLVFSGLLFAVFHSFLMIVFMFLFSFGLWFYSHKLRRKILTAELSASLLIIAPFFPLVIHYHRVSQMTILFLGYIFLISFIREIIKKMVSLKGDLIVGDKSLPIVFGIRKTKYLMLTLMIMTVGCIGAISPNIMHLPILYYFFFATIGLFTALILLRNSRTPAQFERLNTLFKILLVTGLMSIPLVYNI